MNVEPSKLPPLKSLQQNNETNEVGTGSIQKLLATTRIQQEIEEQTQRELALRASGSIKTISHERSDAKVTKPSTSNAAAAAAAAAVALSEATTIDTTIDSTDKSQSSTTDPIILT